MTQTLWLVLLGGAIGLTAQAVFFLMILRGRK